MNSLGPGPVAAVYPLPDSEPTLVLHPAILLVDGDEHALELEARALGAMGYERVTRVKGARDALLLLERDRLSADIIVCDLHMPDMDGIEFLQALNASAYRGSVILLSGEPPRLMHSVQRLLGGKRLTILGAITRPARRTELRALLGSWRPQAKPTPDSAAPCALTENDLRLAIAREEWVLHYQPQVSLESGILVGMEALVRWNHPVHGLIYPDRFIELAEACGAIDELSDWVVRTALQQRRLWVSVGAPVSMAVNLSMECFRTPGFWRRFATLVQESGTGPRHVTIEVTESRIMAFSPAALENLIRLRMMGFNLSIDDFGTGHSSLAQLRDVPFTELKIDRSFVSGARGSQVVRPILEGSLAITSRLGMKSVAEGIETANDWLLLRELGCDFAQGYFIGRPMIGDSLWNWLSTWQGRVRDLCSD